MPMSAITQMVLGCSLARLVTRRKPEQLWSNCNDKGLMLSFSSHSLYVSLFTTLVHNYSQWLWILGVRSIGRMQWAFDAVVGLVLKPSNLQPAIQ